MRFPKAQGVTRAQAVPLRPELSAEHGVTLIETLISAVILVIVLFAVLASLDAASHTTAVNRSRTVAAGLAEQELERLRALPATTLASYSKATRTVTVGNSDYQITSDAEWVHDASGAALSCDSDGEQADYIRITSDVRSSVVGKNVKPVTMTSLVAPRVGSFGANQGTLAVQLKNELDAPIANMPVNVAGPVNQVDATNALGCAVFVSVWLPLTSTQPGWLTVTL